MRTLNRRDYRPSQSNLQEDWYRSRQQAFEEIAIQWLEENGIAYTRSHDRGLNG